MRIVTWNMSFNDYAYRPRHDEAWRFLVDELQPDPALVQEAIVPEWAQRQFRVADGKAFVGGTWGSAVLSVNPVEKFLATWERGSVVAATIGASPVPLVAVRHSKSPFLGPIARRSARPLTAERPRPHTPDFCPPVRTARGPASPKAFVGARPPSRA